MDASDCASVSSDLAAMDPRIAEIERAALLAWPAAHVLELDGWKLRFHWNMTGRANSVWPNETTGALSLEERLARVERFYHGRLQPARYQVSPASVPPGLSAALDARRYHHRPGASVQIQHLDALLERTQAEIAARAPSAGRSTSLSPSNAGTEALAKAASKVPATAETVVLARPSEAWFQVQQDALAMDPASAGLRRALIQAIPSPIGGRRSLLEGVSLTAGFALCCLEGEPAAIGIGVGVGGWLGIFGMATVPRFRRHGAALRVMEGLARWASHEGASSAYLQVFEENHSALALYERLGFAPLYVYHYRVEPWKI